MKFGLGPYHLAAWGESDHATVYQEMLAQAPAAEESAFDSVLVMERHFTTEGFCPAPAVAAAALAATTTALRIGVGCHLGLTHPLYVAEDVATLDNISNGRVIFNPGKPLLPQELSGYNLPLAERDSRFWESLEVLLKAWAPQPFHHQGKHYRIPANLPQNVYAEGYTQISVTPKPAQPLVPVWVSASDEDAVRGAAARGLPIVGPPFDTLEQLRAKLDLYREAPGEGGIPPGQIVAAVREVYVAESSERARQDAEEPLLSLYYRYAAGGLLAEKPASFEALARDRFIVGDVDRCVQEIARYRDELGVNYLICRLALPGLDHQKVLEAIALFGRGVISEFRMFGFPTEIRVRALQERPPQTGSALAEAGP